VGSSQDIQRVFRERRVDALGTGEPSGTLARCDIFQRALESKNGRPVRDGI
jgi:hypothetical protein